MEDKRELLKGYGVVCRTPEQAKVMVEFVGDMFCEGDKYSSHECNTLQYSREVGFVWESERVTKGMVDYNHLGNKTYEEACKMCGIGEVEPSFENPVEMEVRVKLSDKWEKRDVIYIFPDNSCLAMTKGSNSLGSVNDVLTWKHCKPIEQEPPKPKMRYMKPLEVVQQHTDKCVHIHTNGTYRTDFSWYMDVDQYKVCRDKTQPIDEWKWEELKIEDV